VTRVAAEKMLPLFVRGQRRLSSQSSASNRASMLNAVNTNSVVHVKQDRQVFAFDKDKSPHVIKKVDSEKSTDLSQKLKRYWGWESLFNHVMPKDYKVTTVSSYESYAKTTMVASTMGTAASVLSIQALLTSIGISSDASLPIAATLNWVLKDGLGQLGGVLFASFINTRFDADPKRFRFGADLGLAISVILESSTAMAPWLFLPIAALANVGKNIAWLSASATKASIHQSFCLVHNLADLTGKAGSQTISASIVGTTLGLMVSPLVASNPVYIVIGTGVFSIMQLAASFRALHFVQLRTLNTQRAWLCLSPALLSFRSKDPKSSLCSLDWDRLGDPAYVSKKESIIHLGRWGSGDGHAKLASPIAHHPDERFLATIRDILSLQPYMKSSLHVNPSVESLSKEDLKSCLRLCYEFEDQHLIKVKPEASGYTIQLWYLTNASPADVLVGFLHAALIARALGRVSNEAVSKESGFQELIFDVRDRMHRENACAKYVYGLEDKGWDVKHIFIEERKDHRIHVSLNQ